MKKGIAIFGKSGIILIERKKESKTMNAIINDAIANGLDWDIFETAIGNTCVQVFYNNYYYVEYEFCGDTLVDCVEYQIH